MVKKSAVIGLVLTFFLSVCLLRVSYLMSEGDPLSEASTGQSTKTLQVSFVRGTVYDRQLYDRAHAVANKMGIPCQTKEGVYGGTEGRSIQTAGAGAKVLAVSLPCRYLHSASCLLAEQDMQAELRLLAGLIEEFGK